MAFPNNKKRARSENCPPTLSILTTVYNRAEFLAECIESVQQSKFQDYEHIIVDDGSTDNSVAIAKNFASSDPKIRVFENTTNMGDYPNRNEAASRANGIYIKYLDADDAHGQWATTVMVDAMQQQPNAQLGIVEFRPIHPARPTWLNPEAAFEAYYKKERYFFDASPINVIMTRKAFQEAGGFTGKRMVGDFEMWQIMAVKHGVLMIPHNLSFYRKHDEQEMAHHALDPIWGLRYLLTSLDRLQDSESPLLEANRIQYLRKVEKQIGRTILTTIKKHGVHVAQKMRDEACWSWNKVIISGFS